VGRHRGSPLNLLGPIWALCSAIAWGTGDFCGGLATRLGHIATTMLVSQVFGFVVCLVIAVAQNEAAPTGSVVFWSLLAGASGIIGIAGFYAALSRGTMGLVAPLTAVIAATIPSVIGIVNGATVGPLLLLGMVVALGSVVVISLPDSAPALGFGRPSLDLLRGSRASEIGLVLVAGLGFAGFFLGLANAHPEGGGLWWPLMLVRAIGLGMTAAGVVALGLVGRLRGVRFARRSVPYAIVAGAGDLGGNAFYLFAITQTSLPVAVVLSSLYPVQTTILARIVLKERLTLVRAAGVGLAVLGVVLISLGSAT
jgi:drug/metabolite transporter (DMT)-like permease